MKYDVSAEGFN